MTFELFRTRAKQFRWRLRAKNGKIVACSGESYRRKMDAMDAIDMVKFTHVGTPIEEVAR